MHDRGFRLHIQRVQPRTICSSDPDSLVDAPTRINNHRRISLAILLTGPKNRGMSGYESHSGFNDEEFQFLRQQKPKSQKQQIDRPIPRAGYLIEISGEAITLDRHEYEILRFLSASPYKAFTRRQIAQAVSTFSDPIEEKQIDAAVLSLRGKLGLFSDYVQSVPYVGYRFKE